jgi:hypothetical protein
MKWKECWFALNGILANKNVLHAVAASEDGVDKVPAS